MSKMVTQVREGFFLDSVALMRISQTIAGLPGVEEAALMMGTPANKEIMAAAGLLDSSRAAASLRIGVCSPRSNSGAADALTPSVSISQSTCQIS